LKLENRTVYCVLISSCLFLKKKLENIQANDFLKLKRVKCPSVLRGRSGGFRSSANHRAGINGGPRPPPLTWAETFQWREEGGRWRNFILLARTNEVHLWESGGFLHLYGQKPPNFSLVPLALAIT